MESALEVMIDELETEMAKRIVEHLKQMVTYIDDYIKICNRVVELAKTFLPESQLQVFKERVKIDVILNPIIEKRLRSLIDKALKDEEIKQGD